MHGVGMRGVGIVQVGRIVGRRGESALFANEGSSHVGAELRAADKRRAEEYALDAKHVDAEYERKANHIVAYLGCVVQPAPLCDGR